MGSATQRLGAVDRQKASEPESKSIGSQRDPSVAIDDSLGGDRRWVGIIREPGLPTSPLTLGHKYGRDDAIVVRPELDRRFRGRSTQQDFCALKLAEPDKVIHTLIGTFLLR